MDFDFRPLAIILFVFFSFHFFPSFPIPTRCLTLCGRRFRKIGVKPFRVVEVTYVQFAISSCHQERPTDSYPGMFRLLLTVIRAGFLRQSWSI